MRGYAPVVLSLLLILSWTPATDAQQSVGLSSGTYSLQTDLLRPPAPGLLTSAASVPLGSATIPLQPGIRAATPFAMQYGWRRTDREIGRTLFGAVTGFFFAWVADLVIHQEYDFSKANWLWNEGTRTKVQNGEVVYNILLYNGLTPLYAKRGILRASPVKTNGFATYMSGLVGSLLGMWYWTELDKREKGAGMEDLRGFGAYFGLTTLFTFMGHRIFK